MSESLLALPIAIQIALGSGYLAYLIAFSGLRQSHTTADAVFGSVAFGLVATATLTWLPESTYLRPAAAVAITILAGVLWRAKLGRWIQLCLRAANVSWADGLPSAWISITAVSTEHPLSQISVDLADGRVLFCEDTTKFAKSPHGPCLLGLDGSVAMYVSSECRADGTWFDHEAVVATDGHKITFVPASQIKRVELRWWTKPSAKASATVPEQEAVQET